jgi:quercetin dioxygenase-like cupin family protein
VAADAELALPCPDLAEALGFFVDRLGFRLDAIFPADDPRVAIVSGHGATIRLEREGTRELARELPPLAASFVLTRASDDSSWTLGRAGMRYRDLVPDRQGGHLVASHIRIPEGGTVPDSVHFHTVRFQLIYCRRGWVRVAYEDQGPPFVLREGDCVLQPPTIRHRVLESSAGLEVVELACPAEHETRIDHALSLPTATVDRDRDFGGQRFVRHCADAASWRSEDGGESRDLGLGDATRGLASARVLRRMAPSAPSRRDPALAFGFVLAGAATLRCEGEGEHRLAPDDAFVVPPGRERALVDCDAAFELLEVRLQI